LVFHGGSGSSKEEIHTAVQNGVVKMNVDTDTQFAYLVGMRVSLAVLVDVCSQH
jgi:fructose-bisphosphate aldolase class II